MARSTVNTDGTLLRSSSVKTRPGSAIFIASRRFVVWVTVTSFSADTARAMIGSSASPRRLSASTRIARPRAEIATGGSIVAVSQRV